MLYWPWMRLTSSVSCGDLVKAGSTVDYLQAIPVGGKHIVQMLCVGSTHRDAVFSGLRVFALSKGNWVLSILVFVLSVVPFGTNMVSASNSDRTLDQTDDSALIVSLRHGTHWQHNSNKWMRCLGQDLAAKNDHVSDPPSFPECLRLR